MVNYLVLTSEKAVFIAYFHPFVHSGVKTQDDIFQNTLIHPTKKDQKKTRKRDLNVLQKLKNDSLQLFSIRARSSGERKRRRYPETVCLQLFNLFNSVW